MGSRTVQEERKEMNNLRPADEYHDLDKGYNNGNPTTIVPYEVMLFNNGIICKKSPHPVIASHMLVCYYSRRTISHDMWPFGFEFTTFHYVHADHEKRMDFIQNKNIYSDLGIKDITYEACSDLKMGDQGYPRFLSRQKAFKHCMKLMIKEFNILSATANNTNRCIKKHVI